MNAKIRILSLLVAAVMIFGCLPMTAFATGVNAVAECAHADENKDCLCDTCGETYHPNVNGQCTSCGVWNFETSRIESNETVNVYNVTMKDSSNFDERNYVDDSTDRTYSKAAFMSIAVDPTDNSNKVLKIDSTTVGSAKLSTFLVKPDTVAEGDIYVVEFDVMSDAFTNSGRPAVESYFGTTGSFKNVTALYTSYNTSTKVYNGYWIANSTTGDGYYNTRFAPGTWVRTRLVYDLSGGKYLTYFSIDNGESWIYAKSSSNVSVTDVTLMGVRFNVYNCNGTTYIDNLVSYRTNDSSLNIFDGEDLNRQLASAKSGETVKLYSAVDYTGNYITIPAGATLDLNGFNLTAEGVALFNGASIINSIATKGLLKVPQGNVAAANATYKMLPIWNGEGYILTDVTPDGHLYTAETLDTLGENQIKAYFRPQFGDSAATNFVNLLSDGAANNGLSWTVEIDCVKGDAVAQTISFAVPDASIGNIYTDYLQDNPPYITLTVGGAGSNFDSYSVRLVIESDCGITYSEVIGTYTPAVAE